MRYKQWRWNRRVAYQCQEGQILCWFTGFGETTFFKEMRVTSADECLENDYSVNMSGQCRIRFTNEVHLEC